MGLQNTLAARNLPDRPKAKRLPKGTRAIQDELIDYLEKLHGKGQLVHLPDVRQAGGETSVGADREQAGVRGKLREADTDERRPAIQRFKKTILEISQPFCTLDNRPRSAEAPLVLPFSTLALKIPKRVQKPRRKSGSFPMARGLTLDNPDGVVVCTLIRGWGLGRLMPIVEYHGGDTWAAVEGFLAGWQVTHPELYAEPDKPKPPVIIKPVVPQWERASEPDKAPIGKPFKEVEAVAYDGRRAKLMRYLTVRRMRGMQIAA